ncbi:MAG: hypothetical protein JW839_08470 [Candidatus Lokiarchaeota archaeon]|nr:hypothetical protein [Candidatus Lokiarchaeota archaeon]
MVTQDDRKRDQLAGSEENIFQKYLDQLTDFATKILNLKPKEGADASKGSEPKAAEAAPGGDIMAKAKELSKNAVKGLVNTGDSILKSLKLDENEQVKKMADDAKKFLKQMGLLEEEFENEEYY